MLIARLALSTPSVLRFSPAFPRALTTMQRPRNRQPRQSRQDRDARSRNDHSRRNVQYYPVPNISQVRPGASVSIVLKQDQPTGHQVQGIVQDVLTSGNHPRGIKVRLTDGRVGRVQQMTNEIGQVAAENRQVSRSTANDSYLVSNLPARGLADYLPAETSAPKSSEETISVCPVCDDFRGDEIAVSRHVEEHFT